jgi:3-isopropylmalate/(R)-2-methylmalate dehydratase small subunit
MRAFTELTGPAIYLPVANIDTDVILPARFLKALTRKGLAGAAFFSYRFDAAGAPLEDSPFLRPDLRVAPVLIVGENFGCGSSREHAAWALYDFGVRAIISPTFADIFASNAFKNGILTIELSREAHDRLVAGDLERVTIDLAAQTITAAGTRVITFDIDPFRKHCLLNGLDEISLTEQRAAAIDAFERERLQRFPSP